MLLCRVCLLKTVEESKSGLGNGLFPASFSKLRRAQGELDKSGESDDGALEAKISQQGPTRAARPLLCAEHTGCLCCQQHCDLKYEVA